MPRPRPVDGPVDGLEPEPGPGAGHPSPEPLRLLPQLVWIAGPEEVGEVAAEFQVGPLDRCLRRSTCWVDSPGRRSSRAH